MSSDEVAWTINLSLGLRSLQSISVPLKGTTFLSPVKSSSRFFKLLYFVFAAERLGNFLDLGLSKKAISRKENGKWFLNLEKIALLKLHALCIKSQSMECIRLCTSCDERFPSFRRDRRVDKKILSAIGLKQ